MTVPQSATRNPGTVVIVIVGGAVCSFVAGLIAGRGTSVVLAGRPGTGARGPSDIVIRAPDGRVRLVSV